MDSAFQEGIREQEREFADLDTMSDEALRDLIGKGRDILEARKRGRERQALAQIREIARAHGLRVEAKGPPRRRGRRPKGPAA